MVPGLGVCSSGMLKFDKRYLELQGTLKLQMEGKQSFSHVKTYGIIQLKQSFLNSISLHGNGIFAYMNGLFFYGLH